MSLWAWYHTFLLHHVSSAKSGIALVANQFYQPYGAREGET